LGIGRNGSSNGSTGRPDTRRDSLDTRRDELERIPGEPICLIVALCLLLFHLVLKITSKMEDRDNPLHQLPGSYRGVDFPEKLHKNQRHPELQIRRWCRRLREKEKMGFLCCLLFLFALLGLTFFINWDGSFVFLSLSRQEKQLLKKLKFFFGVGNLGRIFLCFL